MFTGCEGIKKVEETKTEFQQDGNTAGAEDFKHRSILVILLDLIQFALKATHGLTGVNWLGEQHLCYRNFPGGE